MLFFLRLLACLPDWILYLFSDVLAWFLCYVIRYRRRIVYENITRVFPEKNHKFRSNLTRKFYRHLSDVVVEVLMLSRLTPEKLLARVEIVGMNYLDVCVKNKQSMLLLSAHQGNWEWMLTAIASAAPCPLDALYRPLHNASMNKFFLKVRTRLGASMVPANNAARVILKLRKQVRAFGILGDQNPRRKDEKYWSIFMGLETPVVIGPERIAKLTGYPMFYVATERVARGKYRCVIAPLAEAPYSGDGVVSQLYMNAIEAHVKAQPECWMWSHHRWRYGKAGCPDRYGSCSSD